MVTDEVNQWKDGGLMDWETKVHYNEYYYFDKLGLTGGPNKLHSRIVDVVYSTGTDVCRVRTEDLDFTKVQPNVPPRIVCSKEKWLKDWYIGGCILYSGDLASIPTEEVDDLQGLQTKLLDLDSAVLFQGRYPEIKIPFSPTDLYIEYWGQEFKIKMGTNYIVEHVGFINPSELELSTVLQQLNDKLHSKPFLYTMFYAFQSKGHEFKFDVQNNLPESIVKEFLQLRF
jgi:hypothetical protein